MIAPEIIAAVVIGIVLVVLISRKGDRDATPPRQITLTVHGNSALAGGWFDGPTLRFYDPTPVQMLAAKLPGIRIVDCAQNGLTFSEALEGGTVKLGQPVLGQMHASCTSLADIWADVRPTHALIALGEVEPLLDPDWTAQRLAHQITDAVQQARALGVQPILQGCIHFRAGGPVTHDGRLACSVADDVIQETAERLGIPFIDVRCVSFDPDRDVCPDGLHPTGYMHERYTDVRADAIARILTTEAGP